MGTEQRAELAGFRGLLLPQDKGSHRSSELRLLRSGDTRGRGPWVGLRPADLLWKGRRFSPRPQGPTAMPPCRQTPEPEGAAPAGSHCRPSMRCPPRLTWRVPAECSS